MQIVLIGGAKGVGKTTVVEALRLRRPEWTYAYNGAYIRERLGTMPFVAIKERMIDNLLSHDAPILIVDTHYAQRHNGRWQTCWSDKDIVRLTAAPRVEKVQTYIVSAPPEEVYSRRADDISRKRRVDMLDVKADLHANNVYLWQMNVLLGQYSKLGHTWHVVNDDPQLAAATLERLVVQ